MNKHSIALIVLTSAVSLLGAGQAFAKDKIPVRTLQSMVSTIAASPEPTLLPSPNPTAKPTAAPTAAPTAVPTLSPSPLPSALPSPTPTPVPIATPAPTAKPTASPSPTPVAGVVVISPSPSLQPSPTPTEQPIPDPTPNNLVTRLLQSAESLVSAPKYTPSGALSADPSTYSYSASAPISPTATRNLYALSGILGTSGLMVALYSLRSKQS